MLTQEAVKQAEATNNLSDIDMIVSPFGGHLVVVAQHRDSSGMLQHVCWACWEPFEPENPKLAGVEKRATPESPPILMHRKCKEERKVFLDMATATRGLQLRRAVAQGFKAAAKIIGG